MSFTNRSTYFSVGDKLDNLIATTPIGPSPALRRTVTKGISRRIRNYRCGFSQRPEVMYSSSLISIHVTQQQSLGCIMATSRGARRIVSKIHCQSTTDGEWARGIAPSTMDSADFAETYCLLRHTVRPFEQPCMPHWH